LFRWLPIMTSWRKVKQSWMLRKHAHIPDNDYWGICLFHVVWTNFFCNYSYVVQTCTRICRFLVVGNIFRIETCMNSLLKIPPYSKLEETRPSSPLLWRLINFRLFCSDDCWSWPCEEKLNNHGCFVSTHTFLTMIIEESRICRFLVVGNIFRLETCMNSLVKILPYSKLNFQGKTFFTQNWCNFTLS
jgi:hypothetical protein